MKAGGARLIETGLRKIEIADGASAGAHGRPRTTAMVPGARARDALVAGARGASVLRDDVPSSHASGLARARAVGNYKQRLAAEVREQARFWCRPAGNP